MSSHYAPPAPRQHALLRILFLGVCTCVLASMVTPNDELQLLINRFDWLRGAVQFFRNVAPGVQTHHILSFAAVGIVARIGWPEWRAWHVALGLYVVAGFTELAQVWVPGRVSSVWHVLLDVIGGLAGFLLAWLAAYAWGNEAFRGMHAPDRTETPQVR